MIDIKQIRDYVSSQSEDVVKFLRDVIAIPSTSGKEGKVIERIKSEMERVGFDEVFVDKIGNVVGRIGNGKTKILYDSHIDIVDIGDPSAWSFDPFIGKYENGIVYGRGASDNKAAIACMVYGGKAIKNLKLSGDYTLYVAGIVQEEDCDGLAVMRMIQEGYVKPDYVVLGECTNLDIYRGHRGRMEIKIDTKGVSCHASAPERGVNAVYKMAPIVLDIEKLNDRLKVDPFLGKGSVAVTKIECITGSLNVVPDKCTIYLDRRLTFGETKETAIQEIKSLSSFSDANVEVLMYDTPSYTGYKYEIEKYFPTWVLEENHILVQKGVKTAEMVLGKKPAISKWIFSTDGVSIMGRLGIPTIGFGPGEEKYAHTVQDQVSLEHLLKAIEFYTIFPMNISE